MHIKQRNLIKMQSDLNRQYGFFRAALTVKGIGPELPLKPIIRSSDKPLDKFIQSQSK